jgi:hypothetical protein
MKYIAVLSLLSLSANAVVVKRQHDMSNMGGGLKLDGFKLPAGFDIGKIAKSMPKEGFSSMMNPEVRKASKIEQMDPKIHPDAKRVKITYGPYKIRAANVCRSHSCR